MYRKAGQREKMTGIYVPHSRLEGLKGLRDCKSIECRNRKKEMIRKSSCERIMKEKMNKKIKRKLNWGTKEKKLRTIEDSKWEMKEYIRKYN